jgi:hypothetical protein
VSTIPNDTLAGQGATSRYPVPNAMLGRSIWWFVLLAVLCLTAGGFIGYHPLMRDAASLVISVYHAHSAPVAGVCGGGVGVPC